MHRASAVRRVALGLTLLLVVAGHLPAAPPDARTILRRAEAVRSPNMDYAVDFRLDVTSPASTWKKRHASYSLVAHGKDHTLVVMREPRQFHPGTLLIAEGAYWLLLPRSERPFQLSPRQVLNGDISNGDLARGNLLEFYEPTLVGKEKVLGEPCWVLDLERTRNLGLYRRIRASITKQGFRPKKFEYYGETGTQLKVAYYEEYREGAIGLRAMRIQVDNQVRPGEHSVLTFSNLRRVDASAIDFSKEGLVGIRDAFLARRGADGTQAKLDDALPLTGTSEP
jgi:hypothetical protein